MDLIDIIEPDTIVSSSREIVLTKQSGTITIVVTLDRDEKLHVTARRAPRPELNNQS